MSASKIMIIRHAEKPDDKGAQPFGVTAEGVQDKDSLIVQGWQRAGALAGFFSSTNANLTTLDLAVPQVIFASDDHKHPTGAAAKAGSNSKRPKETVTPLAAKLGVDIDKDYWLGDEPALAKAAAASTGVVLICWQHEAIPAIANQLIVPPDPIPKNWPVPQSWPGDRFDVVWIFDPGSTAGTWTFSQAPQNLLQGDKNSVIKP
jgi:hypothetical protein